MITRRPERSGFMLLLFSVQCFRIVNGFSGRQTVPRFPFPLSRFPLSKVIPSSTSNRIISSSSLPSSLHKKKSPVILNNDEGTSDEAINGEEEAVPTEAFGVSEKTLVMNDMIQTANSEEEEEKDGGETIEDIISISNTTEIVNEIEETEIIVQEKESTTVLLADNDDSSSSSSSEKLRSLSPKAVLRFIAPTLALWIAPPVMSLIDTSAVGRFCGATDLAATNLVTNANANASTTSDDRQESDRIVSEALFLALISGIGLGAMVLVAGSPILGMIAGEASRSVVPSALKYALVRAFGQPFVIMASVARAAALAERDTKGPLVSVGLAFILNVIGTLTLVTKTPLGIVGAAIGTLCADVASTGFLLSRLRQSRKRRGNNESSSSSSSSSVTMPLLQVPSLDSTKRFLQYAAPIFFTILGKLVVYNGVALSVGRLGSVALAAHQVLLRSFFFWCPVGDSVGMTSQVFLPGILAKERRTGVPQRGAKRLLFSTGVGAGLVAAVLAWLLPARGAGLFTADAAVAQALRRTAPILGLSISMHAVALTCEGMLLAQRDLGFLSKSYIITTIATISLLLSPLRPSTLGGSWWILALFQASRSFQFTLRNIILTNRKSKQLSVTA
ncbi:unnamed protein product [Cylindrotheca closterium]|uniref:Protein DETOXIFICATION n=1 Tax=Cylindrotheca closterium TaxID=2856 RepID=A0AAD2FHJ1_9STRA|nr:unnamed protein product [Cylindrotheca closterium]